MRWAKQQSYINLLQQSFKHCTFPFLKIEIWSKSCNFIQQLPSVTNWVKFVVTSREQKKILLLFVCLFGIQGKISRMSPGSGSSPPKPSPKALVFPWTSSISLRVSPALGQAGGNQRQKREIDGCGAEWADTDERSCQASYLSIRSGHSRHNT